MQVSWTKWFVDIALSELQAGWNANTGTSIGTGFSLPANPQHQTSHPFMSSQMYSRYGVFHVSWKEVNYLQFCLYDLPSKAFWPAFDVPRQICRLEFDLGLLNGFQQLWWMRASNLTVHSVQKTRLIWVLSNWIEPHPHNFLQTNNTFKQLIEIKTLLTFYRKQLRQGARTLRVSLICY